MRLTDFFRGCANAIKSAVFGSPDDKKQSSETGFTPTDAQALELFAEIRAMELSHKSERGNGAGCNERAHAIYEILADRGVKNIEKAWISSPLTSNGKPNFLIKPPIEVLYQRNARNFGEGASNRVIDNQPYNIHVAPVTPTVEGRRLVFDTYFYETPPEQDQWQDDFKPYEDGVVLNFQLTSPEYVYFNEIGSRLPKEGSWTQLWQRSRASSQVQSELRKLDSNPVDTPLKAKWLEERQTPEPRHDSGPESAL